MTNTLHFGMKGGGVNKRQQCWADLILSFDSDLGKSLFPINITERNI